MSDCSNNCAQPQNFPRTISNPPGLRRVNYRIGRYEDFRRFMLGELDRSPLLLPWTHRGADDPGIAMIEGAAILGDILIFYQELYANEAWLHTANWEQSIAYIVRLIGYRPAPGLGGEGLVAFEVRGNSAVNIPANFPFTAEIVGQKTPVDFETSADLLAVPALSQFALYAPTEYSPIMTGTQTFSVLTAALNAARVALAAKDKLLLVVIDGSNNPYRQPAVISAVAQQLDRANITIAGSWQGPNLSSGVTLRAYKLGRQFHAFGYNAPQKQVVVNNNTTSSEDVDTTIGLRAILTGFPLERTVDDLSAGATMLVDLTIDDAFRRSRPYFAAHQALAVKSDTDIVGPLTGGVTRVVLEQNSPYIGIWSWTDRRTAFCTEVIGIGFDITGERYIPDDLDLSQLDYYGDGASYQALSGRLMQFVLPNSDDTAKLVEESTAQTDPNLTDDADTVCLRRLSLAPALQQFTPADFPMDSPPVNVFGNLVAATQGKTQRDTVLGNGDARQSYQSFQLPKAPLTWLGDETATPPRDPQLLILVNGIAWNEVDSLFAAGPKDTSYVVRVNPQNGTSWVQFGDGINGAHLPSGVANIVARYRTGVGANGNRKSGTTPQPSSAVQNLKKIRLYNEVTGGADPETGDHARQAAPGRVETLGRLVSLADFEAEALLLPGVEKAAAAWDLTDGAPAVSLTVLLQSSSEAQLESVQTAMSIANVARGAARFPVNVLEADLAYVYLDLIFGLLPGYQNDSVVVAIANALGILPADGSPSPDAGLFSLAQRALGETEYATRIQGVVQNVTGVDWVEVTAFGLLGSAGDPSTLLLPNDPKPLAEQVVCSGNRVLALFAKHFTAAGTAALGGAQAV